MVQTVSLGRVKGRSATPEGAAVLKVSSIGPTVLVLAIAVSDNGVHLENAEGQARPLG